MKNKLEIIGYTFILLLIIFGLGACSYMGYANEQTIDCTVEDKWIKRTSSKSNDKYLVSCDGKVYKISDLFFKGKFNSADIYANLKVGNKYKITVTGYRNGFISEYQNINSYKLIGENINER